MPWYANAVHIPPRRPVTIVAIRHARSLASVPEFTNSTVSSSGGHVAISRSASSIALGCRYRVCVLMRALWRAIAATTRGCACPTHGTLLYASSNRRPLVSVIQTPSADATSIGCA